MITLIILQIVTIVAVILLIVDQVLQRAEAKAKFNAPSAEQEKLKQEVKLKHTFDFSLSDIITAIREVKKNNGTELTIIKPSNDIIEHLTTIGFLVEIHDPETSNCVTISW